MNPCRSSFSKASSSPMAVRDADQGCNRDLPPRLRSGEVRSGLISPMIFSRSEAPGFAAAKSEPVSAPDHRDPRCSTTIPGRARRDAFPRALRYPNGTSRILGTHQQFRRIRRGPVHQGAFKSSPCSSRWWAFVAGCPSLADGRTQTADSGADISPAHGHTPLTVVHGGCFGCIYSWRGAGGYQISASRPCRSDPNRRSPLSARSCACSSRRIVK